MIILQNTTSKFIVKHKSQNLTFVDFISETIRDRGNLLKHGSSQLNKLKEKKTHQNLMKNTHSTLPFKYAKFRKPTGN